MKDKKFRNSKVSIGLEDNKLKIKKTEILEIEKPNLLEMRKLALLNLKK